jgi:FkbM family methyltransferase
VTWAVDQAKAIRLKLDHILNKSDQLYRVYRELMSPSTHARFMISKRRQEILRRSAPPNRLLRFGDIQMRIDPNVPHDLEFLELYLRGGTYESETSALISARLKRGNVFVDAGANNGYYSLLAAQLVGQEGMVYAFEPATPAFARLVYNLALNRVTNVRPFNVGLGSEEGQLPLVVSDFDDGLNSFLVGQKAVPGSRTVLAAVKRLDDVIVNHRVDLIKIDVEGSESEVVKGAEQIIEANAGIGLVLEYNREIAHKSNRDADRAIRIVHSMGLRTWEIRPGGRMAEIYSHHDLLRGFTNIFCARS